MKIDTTSGDFDYTYLSLGAGVQSSALLVLACTDDRVPKPDVAIFADTGDEPPWVYEYVDVLKEWVKPYGVPIEVVQNSLGSLSDVYINHQRAGKWYARVPIYTMSEEGHKGMTGRHCTREFKISPIEKRVRELLGYKPRQRVKERVRSMHGISLDEVQRMKASSTRWLTVAYPLVDLGIDRRRCFDIIKEAGLPEPSRSACVYCPYHSDTYWNWLKTEQPEAFAQAVSFDHEIRRMPGRNDDGFVHRSCVPLDEAVFDVSDPDQVDMFGECEGMCGV